MGKSLDGIKKISQSGLDRSRRVVLRAIGEKEEEVKNEGRERVKPKEGLRSGGRVDGLNKFSLEALKKAEEEKIAYRREAQKKQEEEIQKKLREAEKAEEEKLRQAKIENARREEEARIAQGEKRRKEERLQTQARQEAERKEEKKKTALIKKEEEERARQEDAEWRKREEKRSRQKEFIRKLKTKGGYIFSTVRAGIIFSSKKFLPTVLIIFAVYGVVYFGLCVSLLIFKVNNENLKKLGKYFPPVPALLSADWVVDYYVYVDATTERKLSADEAKDYFMEKEALSELYGRYNLPTLFLGEEALKQGAEKLILADNKVNQTGLARIKKIRELVSGNNFLEFGAKYADNHGTAKISELALELPGGLKEARSPVITGKDGYYILESNQAVWEEDSKVNYIFVKAVTLTDYVLEKKNNSKVWALVRN